MLDPETFGLALQALLGHDFHRVGACWITQHQGQQGGVAITSIIGVIKGDLRQPITRERGFAHEMHVGEMILRPARRYTDGDHASKGLAGLIMENHPDDWKHRIESGVLVPNGHHV